MPKKDKLLTLHVANYDMFSLVVNFVIDNGNQVQILNFNISSSLDTIIITDITVMSHDIIYD